MRGVTRTPHFNYIPCARTGQNAYRKPDAEEASPQPRGAVRNSGELASPPGHATLPFLPSLHHYFLTSLLPGLPDKAYGSRGVVAH
jgi:hypothetical protein